MAEGAERFLVFAGMRNEGAFLVEWISWYRMLGFDILVGVNDCTDHSPALLDAFAQAGWLTWFTHRPAPGVPPKRSAHRAMRQRPELDAANWLLICDADEFLVLHRGDGTIGGFLDTTGRDFLGMAFHWKCFGNSGHLTWQDGLVHRMFTRCGPGGMPPNANFKTLVRQPRRFGGFDDHSPFDFNGTWGPLPDNIVDCEGRPIASFLTERHPVRFTPVEGITHRTAQMNHYVIRSDESFGLKRGTASASALKDRYTDLFYRRRNRNEKTDVSALAFAGRFDPVHAAAMALPGVRRLHHLCCADYAARLAARAGRQPEEDARWQRHMMLAAETLG